jgi:hypothetical protein
MPSRRLHVAVAGTIAARLTLLAGAPRTTAVSGVPGLTTPVTESGPYDHYDYTRYAGVIQRGNDYVSSLANTVTHAAGRARANLDADDATANFTSPFWTDRSGIPPAGFGRFTPPPAPRQGRRPGSWVATGLWWTA